MAITPQILETYRAPRRVIRRQLSAGHREDRALAILMLACAIIFISQWPRLAREAADYPSVPLSARIGGALLGWGFIAPLFFYALAALARLVARPFGGHGDWFSARLALFWTLLATAPLWLLHGIVGVLAGPGQALNLMGAIVLAAFAMLWGATIREAESKNAVEFDERVT